MEISSGDFSAAFGDALKAAIQARGIDVCEAARRLGVERETLYTYWKTGVAKRRSPRAELLFRACVEFDLALEFNGYRISATPLNQPKRNSSRRLPEQLPLNFEREFNLTETEDGVLLHIRREPGRVEFSVSLKSVSA